MGLFWLLQDQGTLTICQHLPLPAGSECFTFMPSFLPSGSDLHGCLRVERVSPNPFQIFPNICSLNLVLVESKSMTYTFILVQFWWRNYPEWHPEVCAMHSSWGGSQACWSLRNKAIMVSCWLQSEEEWRLSLVNTEFHAPPLGCISVETLCSKNQTLIHVSFLRVPKNNKKKSRLYTMGISAAGKQKDFLESWLDRGWRPSCI